MIILQTKTHTGKVILALLVAVLAITLWIAWHYQKSASRMEAGVKVILEGFKVERAERIKIKAKLECLERRVKTLEGGGTSLPANPPK